MDDPKYLSNNSPPCLCSKAHGKARIPTVEPKIEALHIANISHELRTPLHGILSFANIALNRPEKMTVETSLRYFQNIRTSGERLLALIDDLLDLTKLESGKMELNYSSGSLESLVKECILEQQARLNELGIEVFWEPKSELGEGAFDRVRIAQVVTNLLSNAIKFTALEKRIEFFISSTIIDCNNKQLPAILFSIRNSGDGIPEGELELIFDQFSQSSNSRSSSKIAGTGLGLAICREIIRVHAGKIWSENHPQSGAVFKFIIPIQDLA
ncbi:MAG: HAMP domain-containing sensor histidine kinase [Pseudomonadota bacterium]